MVNTTEEGVLLKPAEVADMLHVANVTLSRWRQNNTGPKYIRISYNRVLYRETDVKEWISQRGALL
jgi:predicted DNA-binding transcriptional regulator AlpA